MHPSETVWSNPIQLSNHGRRQAQEASSRHANTSSLTSMKLEMIGPSLCVLYFDHKKFKSIASILQLEGRRERGKAKGVKENNELFIIPPWNKTLIIQ